MGENFILIRSLQGTMQAGIEGISAYADISEYLIYAEYSKETNHGGLVTRFGYIFTGMLHAL